MIGNLFETPLPELAASFDPESHPIAGPLLAGGPAELNRRYGVPHRAKYADACQLCYETRVHLMDHFPGTLAPPQMYGR